MIDYVIKIFFWGMIILIINSYLFYTILIWLLSKYSKHVEFTKQHKSIPVSILISAYNEEKVIEKRIHNILDQNYELENIEILVGSDCSSDKTNEILLKLSEQIPQLKVFLYNVRMGKAGVLNELVKHASNEILIFTDANTEFDKNALNNLVRHFNKPEIGGVCGRLILQENINQKKSGIEENKYWKYETFIKQKEGKLGILIGANGGIFAIRKNLFEPIPISKPVTDDLFISLSILNKGYKFIYDKSSLAYEDISSNIVTEFNRKVRFSATNIQTIFFFKSLLFNKNILISYAFWSHKIIRWFLPVMLLLTFILNIYLIDAGKIYLYFFDIQLLFYLAGILGYLFNKINFRISFLSLITYFLLTNIALLVGIVRFLLKKHSVIWQSTPR